MQTPPLDVCLRGCRPSSWSCGLWCMLGSHPPCGQINTYENITLPQTSFAGGIFGSLSEIKCPALRNKTMNWPEKKQFFKMGICLSDSILADREWAARTDRGLWYIPRWRCGAAAHAHAQTEHPSPGGVTQWRHHGTAVRKGLRKRRCRHRNGGH